VTSSPLAPIVAEVTVEAPIDHVWEVLTSEATVPKWLGCMNYRREVGATLHMQQDAARRQAGDITGAKYCDITILQPPHKFSFTWYILGTPGTLVQISLFSEGADRTFVRLVHEGWEQFPVEKVRSFHDQLSDGWRNAMLPNLKAAAEAN
jgi:uncharacterized protein YndB with AHSA1/START domain